MSRTRLLGLLMPVAYAAPVGRLALYPGWSFGTVSTCIVIDLVRNRVFGVCAGLSWWWFCILYIDNILIYS